MARSTRAMRRAIGTGFFFCFRFHFILFPFEYCPTHTHAYALVAESSSISATFHFYNKTTKKAEKGGKAIGSQLSTAAKSGPKWCGQPRHYVCNTKVIVSVSRVRFLKECCISFA